MEFDGAKIKEQGVTFAIIVVKPYVLTSSSKEQILTSFYGDDIFRETFRHQLAKYTELSSDEIKHILGLKCNSTLGMHYLDYENDLIQEIFLKEITKTKSGGDYYA